MTLPRLCFLLLPTLLCLPAGVAKAEDPDVRADPGEVHLHGAAAVYSLLIHARDAEGRLVDRTHAAQYHALDPRVATVTAAGVIRAAGDGATTVSVEVEGRRLSVPVTVTGTTLPRHFNFANDVVPLFSRFGCNSSGCHGKAEGQNGFKLSVFGFDPAADHAALTQEARGRRVFPASPAHSLLLRKVSGQAPHGGGVRIPANSPDFETLRAWIAAGVPFGSPGDPMVSTLRVEPGERTLDLHGRQQLRVVAAFSDGHEADVTGHARFQSNNEGVALVEPGGLVTATGVPGEAAVMAAYLGAVDTFRVVVPRVGRIDPYPTLPENNFIDRLVFRKLRQLNLLPSGLADDAEFLRRVYLDVIGTLPTAAEARGFLHDPRPDRRARLVDELLERPEFADFNALQWADLLRVDRQALGRKQAYAYYQWIRAALADHRPLDEFARALLTAEGPLDESAPGSFYKAVPRPGDMASSLAQAFLGVRIACAECHHHPFDRWSQDDYFGMQAYFNGVAVRNTPRGEALLGEGPAVSRNPRTGREVPAHPLGMDTPARVSPGDQRAALATWLTRPDNPWFARNLANRAWAHFLGRGLVEPVDDVRATNPPSNPELLDALARHLAESHFDLRALVRTITASQVYQLSSRPNATNERDEQNYSRALFKRVSAEVLFDMVGQVTGVRERLDGAPPGTRAIQLWDSKVPHYFLKVFGRPERVSACACERNLGPSVAQVLHLLNAPEIHARLGHDAGYLARLVQREPADGPLVEELYLTFFSRPPDTGERQVALEYLLREQGRRRQAVEDLAWSLMNTLEFLFNH